MSDGLSEPLLVRLSQLVASKTALHFPPERYGELNRRLVPAAAEFGFGDTKNFGEWLLSAPLSSQQLEGLASHLTVPETYFWREPQVFQALEQEILPELIRTRRGSGRRLRIWSAGCATGEEPYSLAIALLRALPVWEDWQISILATDLNPRLLRRAQEGVYGPWSFRNAPPWLKQDYFRPTAAGRLQIRAALRDMVSFAYLNLAEDVYPSVLNSTSAMDIIFCRNVLMYFLPQRARQVGHNLYRCLVEGGWLMVGACELSQDTFGQFQPVRFPGAVVYCKQASLAPPWPAPAPAPLPWLEELPAPPPLPVVACPAPPVPAVAAAPVWPLPATAAPPPPPPPPAAATVAPSTPAAQIAEARDIRELANQGRLSEALAQCEEALAQSKLDPGLHYLRASILQEQEQPQEAIASLRRALYLEPKLVMAHFALGNLMLRQGDAQAARRCFNNVLGLLDDCQQDEVLPEAEGLTVGRFREITQATILAGGLA
ncbi:MAG: CheR family methyltransferase [Thermodesulfobacteriota bacterium]